jgi:dihydroorotase
MKILIKNAQIVNEGEIFESDILIEDERISKIDNHISPTSADVKVIDVEGKYVFPGIIDDQVHFREPGLTHKGEIFTESRAAAAGGITSFIEQPNTVPPAVTLEKLEQKYELGAKRSVVNYSFMMGTANDSLDQTLAIDPKTVPGIKVFMGSSTGNMLVDNPNTLERLFRDAPTLVVTHCEDEATIKANLEKYKAQYGDDIPMNAHPLIRSEEACYKSSSFAFELAKKYDTRLHIFHVSTAKELSLFSNKKPLREKRITAEVCIHHLWFNDSYYDTKGSFIKWNPAVKTEHDRSEIFKAVLDDRIDVVATDHAPHTLQEKENPYTSAPSGGPMVQHALVAMLEFYHRGEISLEKLVEKMAHNPAILFNISERGYLREGYYADLTIVDLHAPWNVNKDNILYKCGWSPMEGVAFRSRVMYTLINGHLVYNKGKIDDSYRGKRLTFER